MSDLQLPWTYRPIEHDDWGTIRNASGIAVASARADKYFSASEYDDFRERHADPYEKIGKAIIHRVNAHDKLVEALEAMLRHSCVADSAGEDKFPEDHAAERDARAALALAKEGA
jgi:hypothetical protein